MQADMNYLRRDRGYVHVNTGDGPGKTTAALGISLRTLVSGGNVFFGQFMKGLNTAELILPEYFENFRIEQFGDGSFIYTEPSPVSIKNAALGLERIRAVLFSGDYDLVVMDELNTAIAIGLIKVEDALEAIQNRDLHTEVVITGRSAPKEIIEYADLVTYMKKIRHYYDMGVPARKGIEY